MANLLERFLQDECGATALDYGLMVALTLVGVIGALNML